AGADRLLGRADARCRLAPDEFLDDPIFERMEADHGQPPAGGEDGERAVERLRERGKFVVGRDPQCLKRAGRRMGVGPAPTAHGIADDLGESRRRLDWRPLAFAPDRLDDPPGPRFLAGAPEDLHQILGRQRVDKVRRRLSLRAIESHVERPGQTEGEAALGGRQLEGGEPEIEENAVERSELLLSRNLGKTRVVPVNEPEAVADRRVPGEVSAARDGLLVGVESDDDAVRSDGIEDGARMTATAKGTIEVATTGTRIEAGDGLGEEDGEVPPDHRSVVRRWAISVPSFSIRADWASHRAGLQISIDVLTPTT